MLADMAAHETATNADGGAAARSGETTPPPRAFCGPMASRAKGRDTRAAVTRARARARWLRQTTARAIPVARAAWPRGARPRARSDRASLPRAKQETQKRRIPRARTVTYCDVVVTCLDMTYCDVL